MPFVKDTIGQITTNFSNTVQGSQRSVQNAVGQAVRAAQNQITGAANQVVNNTVKATVGAGISALTNLAQGDVSGAISSLNPSNILDSALSGLGSSSSMSLSVEPGYAAAFSSTGGVPLGDALSGAQARPDPMLGFLWYAQLPVIGGSAGTTSSLATVPQSQSTGDASGSSLFSQLLGSNPLSSPMGGALADQASSQLPWYYVEEATVPFRQFQQVGIFRDGRERHYPSRYTVSPLRLGIYADTGNNAIQYLQAWQNAVIQPFSSSQLEQGGGWGRPYGYKKPIYVYLLDPSKSVLAILEYTECWPVNVQDLSLVSNSSDRLIYHVEFSVGDVRVNLMDVPQSLTSQIIDSPFNNVLSNAINNGIGLAANAVSSAVSDLFS